MYISIYIRLAGFLNRKFEHLAKKVSVGLVSEKKMREKKLASGREAPNWEMEFLEQEGSELAIEKRRRGRLEKRRVGF